MKLQLAVATISKESTIIEKLKFEKI